MVPGCSLRSARKAVKEVLASGRLGHLVPVPRRTYCSWRHGHTLLHLHLLRNHREWLRDTINRWVDPRSRVPGLSHMLRWHPWYWSGITLYGHRCRMRTLPRGFPKAMVLKDRRRASLAVRPIFSSVNRSLLLVPSVFISLWKWQDVLILSSWVCFCIARDNWVWFWFCNRVLCCCITSR